MLSVEDLGRLLLVVGLIVAAVGLVLLLAGRLPLLSQLGRLPGDIVIRTDGVTCFVPIVTMLLLSAFLTLLLTLLSYLFRR